MTLAAVDPWPDFWPQLDAGLISGVVTGLVTGLAVGLILWRAQARATAAERKREYQVQWEALRRAVILSLGKPDRLAGFEYSSATEAVAAMRAATEGKPVRLWGEVSKSPEIVATANLLAAWDRRELAASTVLRDYMGAFGVFRAKYAGWPRVGGVQMLDAYIWGRALNDRIVALETTTLAELDTAWDAIFESSPIKSEIESLRSEQQNVVAARDALTKALWDADGTPSAVKL